ncbi:MAG: DUF3592 domain-containing protein [Verrucomicrobiae bacterium]|nr:DUF3592 domain-containing protein [Verrucomicrobiae bacterium]
MKNEDASPPLPPRDIGGRIWKCLMGSLLIVAGWVFVTYLWNAYMRAAQMDEWVEAPCLIESVHVDDTQKNQRGMPKYLLEVTYRYQWQGHDYLGNRIRRLPTEASDPRKLKKKLEQYAVGTETMCFFDPDAPELVVLQKDSKAPLYTLWFPCLFIAGGAGMILSALFRKRA